jgi:hypothetical protein
VNAHCATASLPCGTRRRSGMFAIGIGVPSAGTAFLVAAHPESVLEGATALDTVDRLRTRRREPADLVARSKWLTGEPIVDPAREQASST